MATPPIDSLVDLINKKGLNTGNKVLTSTGAAVTASTLPYVDAAGELEVGAAVTASKPVYIDASSVPQAGNIPFVFPFSAGATDTSYAVAAIIGSATGSADELMHLTLVKGANATATIAGYYRVTVTDSAGVITTGDYYAPFYTLA